MYIIKVARIANALAVPSQTAGVWTSSFNLEGINSAGVWLQANSPSSGTIAIRVVFEESWNTPTTQGIADPTYVVPDAFPDVWSDINDSNPHIKQLLPVCMSHGRYKLIGLPGNAADVTVTMYNNLQELGRSYGA